MSLPRSRACLTVIMDPLLILASGTMTASDRAAMMRLRNGKFSLRQAVEAGYSLISRLTVSHVYTYIADEK